MQQKVQFENSVRSEVLSALHEVGEQDANSLITIRNPVVLKTYGWKEPFPSYVTAAPILWQLWLDQTTR